MRRRISILVPPRIAIAVAVGLIATVVATTASAQSPQSARPRATPVLVDRIVAVVNNEVITKNELDERIRIVLRQLKTQDVQPPPTEVLERQVLERLITDRAQLYFAKDIGLKIEDAQLEGSIARIAQQNKMSVLEFRRALERDGVSFDKLREDVRTEMTLARLREREVDAKIQVSDSEIDNFIAENEGAGAGGEQAEFNVSHILVRVPEGANAQQLDRLQEKARDALSQLRGGAEFAKIAVGFSDAPDGLQGGSMGWRTRDRLPELFSEVIDRLRPGETSDVLRSPAGFHILRLVERRGAKLEVPIVDQARVRHLLIRANELVSDVEARRKASQLRERIVEGADFGEIARLNSDDSSAGRGGDLGWVFPGDTVPDFENAMNQLKEQAISEPVRSPFGWHVIQVLERKRGELSTDRRRFEARKALRDRKADEAFEEWLRQLRDRAYVEYRLDER